MFSLALCIGFPLFARYGERTKLFPTWLSSIIACYGIGIIVSNFRLWPVSGEDMKLVAGISMFLGLPLLLFAVRIRESIRYAGSMLLAFGLCCLAGLLCTTLVGLYMSGKIADAPTIAGMLVGLYTGGTPNVQAIGIALNAPEDYLVLIQAADVLLGGSYLLGLITFLPPIYAKIFRPTSEPDTQSTDGGQNFMERIPFPKQMVQLVIGVLVTAASAGLCYLLTGGLEDNTALILILTTLSLFVSVSVIPKKIGNSYPLGEYFILVFCVAIGLLADFRELAANGMDLLYFSAWALVTTTLLHLLLCKIFRVDRDTVILSYVAGFYGPVFVVQVAAALRNKHLLAAGIAVSLLGFGIGNYLGISVAYLIETFG
nr:DUF819 family protein [Lewinella sp. W8]